MHEAGETTGEYQCPGEGYAISRAVHLGQLARFYSGCRNCEHRHETGSMSPRQVKRLGEAACRGQEAPLFQADVVGGVPLGMLLPATVRDVAAALGLCLRCGLRPGAGDASPETGGGPREPAVVVAGDGRPAVAELVAAACEGLRWAGCHVVDLGPAGTASLMFAADHLQSAGGVLVGAGQSGSHRVGLKLFGPAGAPLTKTSGLDAVRRQFERGVDRPTRRYGGLRRFQADEPYTMLAAGQTIGQLTQALEISEQTFHRWRNQYGGMKAEEAKRLKELEAENKRLKKLLAEAELDKEILKEAMEGNY